MSTHLSARRRLTAAVVTGGLIATPLALGFTVPAQAAVVNSLVVNEVFGGGNNSGAPYNADFVELYNPTSSAVSLEGAGLQYRSAAGGSGGVATLSGTVPAASTYLVQVNPTPTTGTINGSTLDADLITTQTLGMSASAGQVLLLTSTVAYSGPAGDTTSQSSVIDMVGYGPTATTFERAPTTTPASSSTSTSRSAAHADTDSNAADFATGAPTPTKSSASNALAAPNPGTKTGQVGTPVTGFTLAATGGSSPYTWDVTGLPAGVTASTGGTVSGTPTQAGTSSVTATVTDTVSATASTTFTFTVSPPAGQQQTIAQIQGDDTDTTPFAGQTVTTTGVVTAAYPTGGLDGFYLQTGGPDTTPNASDGVFVFAGSNVPEGSYPSVGQTVTVTGTAKEFVTGPTTVAKNQTEIELGATGTVAVAVEPQAAVVRKAVVPGTDCAEGSCPTGATLAAAREKVESEAFAPSGGYTVTDPYDGSPFPSTSSSNFGEIGLAAGTRPLIQPTELYDAQTEAARITDRVAYNDARRIILDDGSSTNYNTATGSPIPWLTTDHYVRVGAAVTFPQPVVLTEQFDGWTFLPSGGQVVGAPTGTVSFAQDRPAAPGAVGGDLKLATANVLNFFPTTGEEFAALPGNTCTYFTDRAGNRITNNSCAPNGPRGAATTVSLDRQRAKIVAEINGLDADIVSLEEIENSVKLGKDRDFAIGKLVEALNADAGAGTWAYVPSPAPAELPAVAQQDVIRTGFVYRTATVVPVGGSRVLTTESSETAPVGAFSDAREPLAQGFKGVGQTDAKAFAVVVNHFKSKGSGTPDPVQGNANDRRIAQATALKAFADQFATDLNGSGAVFLTGDYNAYEQEDPIQVLTSAGYTALDSTTTPGEASYSFAGLSGSLDHVLANAKARAMVTGVDMWNVNADESVYYEYSRFNYNVTDLYDASAFRASDHSPELIGLALDTSPDPPVAVQILGTNDFHGRLQNNSSGTEAGAAVLAGAVKQLKSQNRATSFVAAGDLIGASTFESFVAKDKPTIDALNAAGLDVSAVGNHEFDQGYADLVDRVMAPYDAQTNPYGGAKWRYLGANVRLKDVDEPALDGTWIKDQGGIRVGYVGAVTEHLDELVSPAGIADIEVTDIVEATNAAADELKGEGADLVVLLVHEGAASTSCDTIAGDTTSDFGQITAGVNANVDAIVSGHTHLAYNCSLPVADWAGRAVTERPVVSAGQYGTNLNQIVFTVDPASGAVQAKTQAILPLKSGSTGSTFNYPADPATTQIVADAVANAEVLGAQPLGQIAGPFSRAKLADGTTENRGGESTLGNLVAEIQRDRTSSATAGSAQIAFMNPGGLRADLVGDGTGAYPRVLTYKQAATVQPFANTLVNEDLTGAQIKQALEQQWQPNGSSRPFLKLGVSKGFTYTYDPNAAAGSRIRQMRLNGTPIDLAATYSVTVNSFLAAGGDNFTALNGSGRKQDTGVTDLQAQVDYFAAQGDAPVAVDASQRAVGVGFPADAPATYTAGDDVALTLSSLSMTGPGDTVDATVTLSLDGTDLGTAPVTTVRQAGLPGFDEAGTASVAVTLPADLATGVYDLVITGAQTGTEARVPLGVQEVPAVETTVAADDVTVAYGEDATLAVTVTPSAATGAVEVRDGDDVVARGDLVDGAVELTVSADALALGANELTLAYAGDDDHEPSTGSVTVTVEELATTVTGTADAVRSGQDATVAVTVDAADSDLVPAGTVRLLDGADEVGRVVLVDGAGEIVVPASVLAAGANPFTLDYGGGTGLRPSSGTVTVTVTRLESSLTATVDPRPVPVRKGTTTVLATVTAAGYTPTGEVEVRRDGVLLGSGTVDRSGVARVEVGPFDRVGPFPLTVDYAGDANAAGSSDTVRVVVVKQVPTMRVFAPSSVRENATPTVRVALEGTGATVTGSVVFRYQGRTVTRGLSGGRTSLELRRLTRTTSVTVRYEGSDLFAAVSRTVTIRVRP